MKAAARDLTWGLARATGAHFFTRHRYRSHLVVVCYHGICRDDVSPDWLLHPLRTFEREIEFLSRRYELLPIDEALARLYGPGLEHPTAAITFDDGYANNLSMALPVLSRFGAPATVYLTTQLIFSGGHLWTVEVQQAVCQSDRDLLSAGDRRVDGPVGSTRAQRVAKGKQIREVLKSLPDEERQDLSSRIVESLGPPTDLDAFRLMTPSELASMDDGDLVTFGAHTRTHPILARLSDRRLEEEIGGSIEDIRGLKHRSNTFAYPNGGPQDYDVRAVRLLRANGIDAGLSTRQWLHNARFDPFHVRRVVVDGNMGFSDFVASVSGLKEALQ